MTEIIYKLRKPFHKIRTMEIVKFASVAVFCLISTPVFADDLTYSNIVQIQQNIDSDLKKIEDLKERLSARYIHLTDTQIDLIVAENLLNQTKIMISIAKNLNEINGAKQ